MCITFYLLSRGPQRNNTEGIAMFVHTGIFPLKITHYTVSVHITTCTYVYVGKSNLVVIMVTAYKIIECERCNSYLYVHISRVNIQWEVYESSSDQMFFSKHFKGKIVTNGN